MTVFIVSAAFIIYVLIGYPLLLEVWARLRPAAVVNKFVPRTVSVLLPVHNGERWLEQKLDDIARLIYPSELIETIVISNGSTDRTAAIGREATLPRTRVIELERADKASALNAGLGAA